MAMASLERMRTVAVRRPHHDCSGEDGAHFAHHCCSGSILRLGFMAAYLVGVSSAAMPKSHDGGSFQ